MESQAVVQRSLEYFMPIAQSSDIHLHYVTTEREGLNSATTQFIRTMATAIAPGFKWHHCLLKHGGKAGQVNTVIAKLLQSSRQHEDFFVAIYDVDSRPDMRIFTQVCCGVERVYQQPSMYFGNLQKISPFQQVGAILQTRWELCHNLPSIRGHHPTRPITRLPACTGHGLFIRGDVFDQVGILSTESETEDIEFGYRLAWHGILPSPVAVVDLVDYALTAKDSIVQTARWFAGELRLPEYKRSWSNRWRHEGVPTRTAFLKRYYLTSRWALGVPVLLMAQFLIIWQAPWTAIIVFLGVSLHSIIPTMLLLKEVPCLSNTKLSRKALLITLGPIRSAFGCLGPLVQFARMVALKGTTEAKEGFDSTPKS